MRWHCCCIVNVTLFSCVTLIRKLQSTSDLDRFHACDIPCSLVKSRDDPISDCRVDGTVPYSFIYIDFISVYVFWVVNFNSYSYIYSETTYY